MVLGEGDQCIAGEGNARERANKRDQWAFSTAVPESIVPLNKGTSSGLAPDGARCRPMRRGRGGQPGRAAHLCLSRRRPEAPRRGAGARQSAEPAAARTARADRARAGAGRAAGAGEPESPSRRRPAPGATAPPVNPCRARDGDEERISAGQALAPTRAPAQQTAPARHSATSRSAAAKIISFANQKGGVAKTTTTLNLAVAFASPATTSWPSTWTRRAT